MAMVLVILLTLAAYFSDRNGGVDEIGLFNPTYMALHYGKMTYPIHGYFDTMVVHPPVHYEFIAALMRIGLTYYYAQATPALLMLLLCVWLIVRGPFPGPVKIGLLYSVWVSVAMFAKFGMEMFGMRPENHLGAAWFAGLIALESGRLEKWNLTKLFLGAFLLTYAAGIHYYAAVSILGAVVYAVWAWWSLGLRSATKPLLAIAGGGLLFGIPYLALFVIPDHTAIIRMISSTRTEGGGGIRATFHEHLAQYAYWANFQAGNFWVRSPFSLGIPLVLISTPLLLAMPATRGIALASLPLQLFVLLFSWHKHVYYYLHEIELYSAAIVAAMLTVADRLVAKLRWRWAAYAVWAGLAWVLCLGWWQLNKWSGGLTISTEPRVQEAEIARAAGREMLGPNARVASRIGIWYASGGEHWHDPSPDLLWPALKPGFDVAYLSQFDAIAEHSHMSNATANGHDKVLLSWYLDGTLKLRGFFFAEQEDAESYQLFSTKRTASVTGFGLKHGQLYRFVEDGAGSYELVTLVSPLGSPLDAFFNRVTLHSLMYLPKSSPDAPQLAEAIALVPPDGPKSYQSILPDSRVLQRLSGNLLLADWHPLVDKLRREDRPMHFYAKAADVPGVVLPADAPGAKVGPPAGAIRLSGVLRLDGIAPADRRTVIERKNLVKVTAPPGMGAYAAAIPISGSGEVTTPCWIQIRARVLVGRVGFGVFNKLSRDFLTEPPLLDKSDAPQDVYIALPSLQGADELIVRSADDDIRSQVILEDVAVWVRKEDWKRDRKKLAELK